MLDASRRVARVIAVAAAVTTAPALAETIKGPAILDHPCGKTATKQMGLLHDGKVEEANRLSTKAVQAQWQSMPDKDRAMMTEMSKTMSPSAEQYSASIRQNGVLTIDGTKAVLTVSETKKDKNGSSTSTMTQNMAMEGGQCLVSR